MLGYAASQWAALHGTAPEYAARVDQAAISRLALLLFLGALIIGFVPNPEGEPGS